ncbi:hypothetical protein CRE_05668 [Caenorhabditis remanei]|uniref:Uncharacterized protein n=1 Tax=Caenorhabditis remanei TaxID=31234 RepID=E3M0N4_CAERE|nr:hypothetical protein CRE_05668 [Caenorhabditis remanei]
MFTFYGLGPNGYSRYTPEQMVASQFTWIEDEAIWEFLHRKVSDSSSRGVKYSSIDPNCLSTWIQFQMETGSRRPSWKLRTHFVDDLSPNLHNAFLTGAAKAVLYFALGISVERKFLEAMRRKANISVDRENRLMFLSQRSTGGLFLKFPESNRPSIESSEELLMWIFLCKKIHDPLSGEVVHPNVMPSDSSLWKEFKDEHSSTKSSIALQMIFQEDVAPNLYTTQLDLLTKAKLCFVLRIPVNRELMATFLRFSHIRLDNSFRIFSYHDMDTGLEMSMDRKICYRKFYKRLPFTKLDECRMYSHIYNKIKDPRTGQIKKDRDIFFKPWIWEEFDKTCSYHREAAIYVRHFRRMLPYTYLAGIPKLMKIVLYYALEEPVNKIFLQELRKNAIVEEDSHGCIVTYVERKTQRSVSTSDACEIINIDNEAVEEQFEVNPEETACASVNTSNQSSIEEPRELLTVSELSSNTTSSQAVYDQGFDMVNVREVLEDILDQIESDRFAL